MADFTKEDKVEKVMGKYFDVGVHRVKIKVITFDKMDDGREFADIFVEGADGQEDNSRVWFHTAPAKNYSFNILKGIFVHNAKEENKDKVRKTIDAVNNTDELEEACQGLVGKEAFFEIKEDPVRTYQNAKGETRPSLNKNVYGYEPTVKTQPAPSTKAAEEAGGEDIELSNIPF